MEKPVMFTIAIGYSESFEILEYMSLNDAGGRAAQLKIDLTKVLAPYTINVTWREEIDYRPQGASMALSSSGRWRVHLVRQGRSLYRVEAWAFPRNGDDLDSVQEYIGHQSADLLKVEQEFELIRLAALMDVVPDKPI